MEEAIQGMETLYKQLWNEFMIQTQKEIRQPILKFKNGAYVDVIAPEVVGVTPSKLCFKVSEIDPELCGSLA